MTAIETRSVFKTFQAEDVEVNALRGIDLEIGRGEFVAIMGPSGSGKSTLLHLLGGLDRPTSGEVVVDGRNLAELSRRQLARFRNHHVGFIFQFFNLVASLTVEENVALPAVLDGRGENEWRPRAQQLLDRVRLGGKAARYPARLSGGEQQRVAVARALFMEPLVLLCDEPTGNLDSATGMEVLSLLSECHTDGQTVVMVTHDVKIASRAQRIVTMRDGLVVDDATVTPSKSPRVSRAVRVGDAD